MNTRRRAGRTRGWMTACMVVILLAGCAQLAGSQGGSPTESTASAPKDRHAPLYYDFPDVLLPRGLEVDRDESFIFNTPGMIAGVLTLRGRFEITSLTNFFEARMPADGWRLVSSIKSPRTKILFRKQSRWCVIAINKGQLSSTVEIWVAPALEGADNGLIR